MHGSEAPLMKNGTTPALHATVAAARLPPYAAAPARRARTHAAGHHMPVDAHAGGDHS
jgi:hypothetical protein